MMRYVEKSVSNRLMQSHKISLFKYLSPMREIYRVSSVLGKELCDFSIEEVERHEITIKLKP